MPHITQHRGLLICGVLIFCILLFNSISSASTLNDHWFLFSACLAATLTLLAPIWLWKTLATRLLPTAQAMPFGRLVPFARPVPFTRLVPLITNLLYFLLIIVIGFDYKLYEIYGFHINGFVINLVLTPGGIESLGASQSFYVSITKIITVAAAVYFGIVLFAPIERLLPQSLQKTRIWIGIFVVSFFAQSYSYALAEYQYDKPVLNIADHIAFHIPITSKKLFEKLGVKRPERPVGDAISLETGKLNYPHHPIQLRDNADKPNIVWLVAESWRSDMLNPQIMPNTWQFAKQGLEGKQHYSGGNGTRMGMFAQFYSLYGSYWFDVLREHRQPVLFDVLDQLAYSKKAVTSARFSYPEFDQTIFSGFKDSELHSFDEGEGWLRDRKNVDVLLQFMQQAQQPYFAFMFFESPHANYYFPPESVIRKEYLPDLDYATMDLERDIPLIRNRYINACHHLDQQFQRVINFLQQEGRLDNTIVIITGDHGEEFMENGRWGHNSTFAQQQIRVPLILAGKGITKGTLNSMSSHVDLLPTLLPLLGVTNPASDYGFGFNLQGKDFDRHYSVVSDWHGSAVVTQNTKFILSKKAAIKSAPLTSIDDAPLDENQVTARERQVLGQFMQEYARYFQH